MSKMSHIENVQNAKYSIATMIKMHVKCQMPNVTCPMSNVTCQMSNVQCQRMPNATNVKHVKNAKCQTCQNVKLVKCQISEM